MSDLDMNSRDLTDLQKFTTNLTVSSSTDTLLLEIKKTMNITSVSLLIRIYLDGARPPSLGATSLTNF